MIGPLREKGFGGVTFKDMYPGLAAILAGPVVIGLLWFLGRVPEGEARQLPDRPEDAAK